MKVVVDALMGAVAQSMSAFFSRPVTVQDLEAWGNHLYLEHAGPLGDAPPGAAWSQEWRILLDGQLVGVVQQVAFRQGDRLQVRSRGGVRPMYLCAMLGVEDRKT